MKGVFRCLVVIIIAVFANAVSVMAVNHPTYQQNFDELSLYEENLDIKLDKNMSNSIIEVDNDPINSSNKVLKVYHNRTDVDRYMALSGDYSQKVTVCFDLYMQYGNFSFYFRYKNSTANNFEFFKVENNKIYFGGETLTFEANRWMKVLIVMDMLQDYIEVYTDAPNGYNGSFKLFKRTTFTQIGASAYENHYKENTTMRFGPMNVKSKYYLDNINIYSSIQTKSDIVLNSFQIMKKADGKTIPVSSLRDGELTFVSSGRPTNSVSQKATFLAVLYGKNGDMKRMQMKKDVVMPAGEETPIELKMNIPKLEEGDYVKMFVVSDTVNIMPISDVLKEEQSKLYVRPMKAEIKQMLSDNFGQNEHPRLFLKEEDFSRLKGYVASDANYAHWLNKLAQHSASYLTCGQSEYKLDARNTMLSQSRYYMNRLIALSFLYRMTGETKYAQAAWNLAQYVSNTSNYPDWNHQNHYLDTAEMALGVAVVYDWCYGYLDASQRQTLRTALYNNCVSPSLKVYKKQISVTHNGFAANTNWNAVCNGGALAAAIAVSDTYIDESSELISFCTTSIEKGLDAYSPAGGYAESPTYWEYRTTYLVWCMSALEGAFDTDFGIGNAPGLKQTGYFPAYLTTPKGNFSYHDGEVGQLNTKLSMYFARRYRDTNLAGMRYNILLHTYYGKYNSPTVQDLMFFDDTLINKNFSIDDLSRDYIFKGIETAVLRENFTENTALCTGIHGGYNDVNHGHLDAGTFFVDMDGERFIDELGADSYALPGYFGRGDTGAGYQYYKKSTEAQNTIMIANDSAIPYGQKAVATASFMDFKTAREGSFVVMNMKNVLGSNASAAKRGVFLTNFRDEIVVQDEITFNKSTDLYWLAHTKGDVSVAADGRSATITVNGKSMTAYLLSDDTTLKFQTSDETPLLSTTYTGEGEVDRSAYKKLYIEEKGRMSFDVAVVFKRANSSYGYKKIPISSWKASGNDYEVPRLTDIKLNGTTIDGFSQTTENYNIVLPYGTSSDYDISYTVKESFTAEKTYDKSTGETKIKVYHVTVPSYTTTYTIKVGIMPKTIQNSATVKYKAVSAVASDTPEKNHTADMAIDNNLNVESRWSSDGDGATLTIDLGSSKSVSGVSLAFMKGAQRVYKFKIQYSENGVDFTTAILAGGSSGVTDDEEMFEFEKAVSARYIRFVGYGNNENAWNSVVEFAAF